MDNKNQHRPDREDPQPGTPSEANTQKHMNYLDEEKQKSSEADRNRQKEWKEGIEQGEENKSRSGEADSNTGSVTNDTVGIP
jgi:hypothetical protein